MPQKKWIKISVPDQGKNGVNIQQSSGKKVGLSAATSKAETSAILCYDANILWNEYLENPASLNYHKWKYLWSNLHTLKIDDKAIQTFLDFWTEYDTWPEAETPVNMAESPIDKSISLDTDEEILQQKIDCLFEKAEQTLQKFLKLAASGYQMPELEYNYTKTAGILSISYGEKWSPDPRKARPQRQIGEGTLLSEEDKEYWTRWEKYKFFSRRKDIFAVLEGKSDSGDTTINGNGLRGRIGVEYQGKEIWISYSGWTPAQDQAISAIAAYEADMMDQVTLEYRQQKQNNPYLTKDFLTALNAV